MGEYLEEDEYDDIENWPSMRSWYEEEINNGEFCGTFDDYIIVQQERCTPVTIDK
jgi:hypothetical protein